MKTRSADGLVELRAIYDAVDAALMKFADQFPPLAVYRREHNVEDYLSGETGGMPNREVVLEEMLMLWLENMNPAFSPFQELFDDSQLEKETTYPTMISSMSKSGPLTRNSALISSIFSPTTRCADTTPPRPAVASGFR